MRWVSSGAGALIKKSAPLLLLGETQTERGRDGYWRNLIHSSVDNNSSKHLDRERERKGEDSMGRRCMRECIKSEKKAGKRIKRRE